MGTMLSVNGCTEGSHQSEERDKKGVQAGYTVRWKIVLKADKKQDGDYAVSKWLL